MNLHQHIHAVVHALRLGRSAEGNDALAEFLQQLSIALTGPLGSQAPLLLPALRALLQAQEQGDFLYVADLLEYELAPRLQDQG